ncbi:MAG: hypothetical protein SFU56_04875 [Capsulimonadales bacterium]|nr:hypothetical protein [Capsulimonadales bacterium]
MAKINQLQVWIIGVVLVLITGLVIFFALIKPAQDRLKAANEKYDAQKAIADTMPAKQQDRKKAETEVAEAKRDWVRYEAALMPNIDLANPNGGLYGAMRQLWIEQIKVLGPKVESFLKKDRKVQILQAGFSLPPPPTDPNQVNRKFFAYDLGTVAVMGTFKNVLDHVSRWNQFDRLVLADGLTLSGNSPRLVGQYRITCFEFTRNDPNPAESWPVAGGPGGIGGVGGIGGGFGGVGGGFGGGGYGGPVLGGGPPPGVGGYGGPAAGIGGGRAGYGGGAASGSVPEPD